MRRLAPIIYAIVFFDALLLFAIVPLLPDYVSSLHLSKTQAGGAIGIYSAATLAVALPAGRIADRLGPRRPRSPTRMPTASGCCLPHAAGRAWHRASRGRPAWPGSRPARRPSGGGVRSEWR
jgi:MFS family permease